MQRSCLVITLKIVIHQTVKSFKRTCIIRINELLSILLVTSIFHIIFVRMYNACLIYLDSCCEPRKCHDHLHVFQCISKLSLLHTSNLLTFALHLENLWILKQTHCNYCFILSVFSNTQCAQIEMAHNCLHTSLKPLHCKRKSSMQ